MILSDVSVNIEAVYGFRNMQQANFNAAYNFADFEEDYAGDILFSLDFLIFYRNKKYPKGYADGERVEFNLKVNEYNDPVISIETLASLKSIRFDLNYNGTTLLNPLNQVFRVMM